MDRSEEGRAPLARPWQRIIRRWYDDALKRPSNPASLDVWTKINGRLPDLANVVFGAVLALSVVSAKDLVAAINQASTLAVACWAVLIFLFRISFGILSWILYFRILVIAGRGAPLKSDWSLIMMTVPLLFFVAASTAFSGLPLIGANSDVIHGMEDYSHLATVASLMLSAAFLNLYLSGLVIAAIHELDRATAAELKADGTFSWALSLGALALALQSVFAASPLSIQLPIAVSLSILIALNAIQAGLFLYGLLKSARQRRNWESD